MKIIKMLDPKNPRLSFEVFPPKKQDSFERIGAAIDQIADMRPYFMSVTYGAGGGTSRYTVEIARHIKERGVTPLAHISCLSSTREMVWQMLSDLKEAGIENVLALRGDVPPSGIVAHDYKHAIELVREIRERWDFCIGAACYPEGHVESERRSEDLQYLKEKIEAGCDFVTTQMFFDNNTFYNFLYRLRDMGVHTPVIAGIMPVTNASQVTRIQQMAGCYMPERFKAILDKFGDNPSAMKQAGIAYAVDQIVDLVANGANGIHVYSMDKPDVALAIQNALSEIIR